jgi:hypothetical protein
MKVTIFQDFRVSLLRSAPGIAIATRRFPLELFFKPIFSQHISSKRDIISIKKNEEKKIP